MLDHAVVIRAASPRDWPTLDLLAWPTRRSRPLAGKALLAERDGVPLAAINLTSGTVLAEPDHTTTEIVTALRFTRYRILRQGGQTGAPRSLLSRPMTGTRLIHESALS